MSTVSAGPEAVEIDLVAVRAWLELVHGTSPGYIHICSTSNWFGRAFSDLDAATDYVGLLDAHGVAGIYMRTTTLAQMPVIPEDPRDAKRGDVTASLSLPGFAGDIDIAGPGHKTKNLLPPDVPTAMSIVREAELPEPTVWVHSGGGIYPWWLLDEVFDVGGDEERARAQQLAEDLQKVMVRSAKRLGWHYGGEVGDLARVLRIPGTINRKAEPVRAAIMEPAGYEHYTFEGLAASVAHSLALLPQERPAIPRQPAREIVVDSTITPGDAFELTMDWADILVPHFDYVCHQGSARMWRRAGSTNKWSASTGKDPMRDRLWVFSSETEFPPNEPITKFHAYAILEHNGDHKAAAKALRARGFGGERTTIPVVQHDPRDLIPDPLPSVETAVAIEVPAAVYALGAEQMTDIGVADLVHQVCGQRFRYHVQQKTWYRWAATHWVPDMVGGVDFCVEQVTQTIIDTAKGMEGDSADYGKALRKFAITVRNHQRQKNIVARFALRPGIGVVDTDFDIPRHLVTVLNGTLDLRTGRLGPHEPQLMLRRLIPVVFNPAASAPMFEQFMATLLPDPELRRYVQKVAGYALSGAVDHRAFFLLYGPKKTGKSQFLNLLTMLFGDFAGTAAAQTFRTTRNESTSNLNGLRGKRFVATSETSESTDLDEELIKRLTGGDRITSRDLYEKNQTWRPECTIFMATNMLPKLSVEDGAIWSRVKPIPFFTQFSKGGANREIHNIAEKIFADEASGVLNWVLAGLAAFQAEGLDDVAVVAEAVEAHKAESDVVATFLANAVDEGVLRLDPSGQIASGHLYRIYQEWSIRQGGRALGAQRFSARMLTHHNRVKNGTYHWVGLSMGMAGALGSM